MIEVEHDDRDTAQPRREWVVRLRRGHHSVVLRQDLGRLSATTFASELRSLLPADIADTTP